MLLAALLAVATALPADGFPRGEVVEKVTARQEPAQSYALYLPSNYSPDRLWPALYMLDARGRALIPIELFRPAAEEFGWILISSYNSRSDTQDDPNSPALMAMWNDAVGRFAIDGRRVYVTGFSGGGRAAVDIAYKLPGRIAGVIGAGAGFADGQAPTRDPPFLYFGTVGDRDFNYYEMRQLDEKLAAAKATHRIADFPGGHAWPPPDLAREAVAWMELQAMKAGARPRDPKKVAELHADAVGRAAALEAAGRPAEASTAWAQSAEDFRGLADVAGDEAKAAALAKEPAVRKALKDARRRDDRDRATLRALGTKLRSALAAPDPPEPAMLAAELGIPALRKTVASDDSLEERLSAERLLANLRAQTGFYLPQQMRDRGDDARARALVLVAEQIDPDNPFLDYNLAASAAREGDAARATADLERAVAKGFRQFERLEQDPDFAPVREDPAFRKWLAAARARAVAANP